MESLRRNYKESWKLKCVACEGTYNYKFDRLSQKCCVSSFADKSNFATLLIDYQNHSHLLRICFLISLEGSNQF